MSNPSMRNQSASLVAATGLLALTLGAGTAMAAQQGTVTLSGSMAQNCYITVTGSGSYNTLDLTASQTDVEVATVAQKCNKKAGYYLIVSSGHCAEGTAGAKLKGAAGTPETLNYKVKVVSATAPTETEANLLESACGNGGGGPGTSGVDIGREVTNTKIAPEQNSTVSVTYTTDGGLAEDTYSDILTITMLMK